MKTDLIRTERHLLKEMGFICHVEHPHKFIMSYLKALETPSELMQMAWNLANDRCGLSSSVCCPPLLYDRFSLNFPCMYMNLVCSICICVFAGCVSARADSYSFCVVQLTINGLIRGQGP